MKTVTLRATITLDVKFYEQDFEGGLLTFEKFLEKLKDKNFRFETWRDNIYDIEVLLSGIVPDKIELIEGGGEVR